MSEGDRVVVHTNDFGDIVGEVVAVVEHPRRCEYCGAVLSGGRKDRRYCNSSCRGKASMERSPGERFWRAVGASCMIRRARWWIRPRGARKR